MEKTELDKGFEQALGSLYQCRQLLVERVAKYPEEYKDFTEDDFADFLYSCM